MKRKTVPLVCYCGKVNRQGIVRAIRAGATTLKQIRKATGAGVGTSCRELNPKRVCCIPDILAILKEETGRKQKSGRSCPHCRPR